jgi:glutamate-1-semialdehyde 2,1-aminomutase
VPAVVAALHHDPAKRVLLAGTYNAHPVPIAAAIATIETLAEDEGDIYRRLERLGTRLESGLRDALGAMDRPTTIVRQGSAFVIYFMDHAPRDWHDLAEHHDFALDSDFRRRLLDEGVYFFPLAAKQCSLSAAHTESDLDRTVEAVARSLSPVLSGVS